jgi:hypothetical protein
VSSHLREQLQQKEELIERTETEMRQKETAHFRERKEEELMIATELNGLKMLISQKDRQIREYEEELESLNEFKVK